MDIQQLYKIKIAFIDLDGTLIDLKVDWNKTRSDMRLFLRSVGMNPPSDKIFAMIKYVARRNPKCAPKLLKILTINENKGAIQSMKIHGTSKLLRFLNKVGVKIYITTTNNQKLAENLLKKYNINKWVNGVIGRKDTLIGAKTMKPNSIHINRLLKKVNIKSKESLIIGNSLTDITFAKNCNTKCFIIDKKTNPSKNYIIFPNINKLIIFLKQHFHE